MAIKKKRLRPIKIDCADANWKVWLKRNLQEMFEVDLLNFDYAADGMYCELLAMTHSMSIRLDTRNKIGKFRKPPPPLLCK